ncbi:hypothetical protein [Nonomuraea dietziae]|uniref:Uncharacterized protein n=1 Tax=Nonomuraea dietziae TaxID=65515 RepID=A0A7W5YDB2_9ACTN|nr:hypothetical protein [Nonomuraea dietziae]MBB3733251.1 hypothetical protein [Nonomuraea dietziae]
MGRRSLRWRRQGHHSSAAQGSILYTPEKVCGAGFGRVDSASLGTAGTVYLLYRCATGENSVATMRNGASGKVAMTAYLEVKGKRSADSGSFQYYAGPVRAKTKASASSGAAPSAQRRRQPLEHRGT